MPAIYLDNNATTRIDPLVVDAMMPYFEDKYGNPNSPHSFGEDTHEAIDKASDQIYKALNARDKDTIVITSGATESINTVHKSFLFDYLKNKGSKNQILTSSLEHSAVKESLKHLAEFGLEIVEVPHKDFVISMSDVTACFNPDKTLLISMMYANNETGAILPIPEIGALAQEHNIPFHSDATQGVGKVPINLQELHIDYMSFSAHKFHGPKGVGALYLRDKAPLVPLLHGGNQMGGFRSGTLNTAYIVGMGEAIALATEDMELKTEKIVSLRDKLEDFILAKSPSSVIRGKNVSRIPNTSFIHFPHLDTQRVAWLLNKQGIAISNGSACSTQSLNSTPSDQLKAQGCRFSLSRFTREEEIDKTIAYLSKIL